MFLNYKETSQASVREMSDLLKTSMSMQKVTTLFVLAIAEGFFPKLHYLSKVSYQLGQQTSINSARNSYPESSNF